MFGHCLRHVQGQVFGVTRNSDARQMKVLEVEERSANGAAGRNRVRLYHVEIRRVLVSCSRCETGGYSQTVHDAQGEPTSGSYYFANCAVNFSIAELSDCVLIHARKF